MASESVSEVIRETERDMAAFEQKAAAAPERAAPEFKPQSRLFTSAQQPMRAAPATAPVMQEPEPQPQPQPQRFQPQPELRESPRMPRVEDFPPMVQAEVDSHVARPHVEEEDERGPLGLLKRLTHGLSREEKAAVSPKLRPADHGLAQGQPEQRRQLSQDAQLYAPRKGQLDDHGRSAPQGQGSSEEDQLEIPAFLRRQAN